MASGFVQRWKGKASFDPSAFRIGGVAMYGSAAVQSTNVYGSTFNITGTYVTISASSAMAYGRIAKPAYAGDYTLIQLTTVSSGIFLTASTDGSVTINGSSINTTLKSTLAGVIVLEATSTANWALSSIYPSTLGFITISTST